MTIPRLNLLKQVAFGLSLSLLSHFTLHAEEVGATSDADSTAPVFKLGVVTHMGKQFQGYSIESTTQRLKDAGIMSFRDEIYWKEVEKEKGVLKVPSYADEMVNTALAKGIDPLIILSYGNPFYDEGGYPLSEEAQAGYIRYAMFLIEHFKGRVHTFELWNEWDMGLGVPRKKGEPRKRPDPKLYADFVASVYPVLKKAYPDVTFLAGGHAMFSVHSGKPDLNSKNPWELMRGWFDEVLSYGLIQNCDGLAMHTYVKAVEDPELWIRWMRELQDRYAKDYNNGQPVPMYVTEVGWFTHSGAGVDHYVQADHIARLVLLSRTIPEIKGLWYFNMANDVFGISHGSGSPRPAYFSLADVSELVSNGEYLGRVETSNPNVYILRFKAQDGSEKWAAWSREKLGFRDERYNSPVTGYYGVQLQNEGDTSKPLQVQIAGMGPYELVWGQLKTRYGSIDPTLGKLTVGPRPQIISGDLSQVHVLSVKATELPDKKKGELKDKDGANQGVVIE
ncbi:hypothetical protein [Coraliomargarita parva]|uniref:hypothetical protein n=1 Tax=Coraliomargarita parva TaxID=3014050 RepID=UPI0022B343CA|nr:hypothetical protein [Coraliomargarita parva]